MPLRKEDRIPYLPQLRRIEIGSQFPVLASGGTVKLRQLGCQTWRNFGVDWFSSGVQQIFFEGLTAYQTLLLNLGYKDAYDDSFPMEVSVLVRMERERQK